MDVPQGNKKPAHGVCCEIPHGTGCVLTVSVLPTNCLGAVRALTAFIFAFSLQATTIPMECRENHRQLNHARKEIQRVESDQATVVSSFFF